MSQNMFAEAAARLLVAEDVLQADHLVRQLDQVLLRGVDHRQPLLQLGEALERIAGGLSHREADALAQPLHPLR